MSRAIIVQNTKNGAFVRLEALGLHARGGNEVLLAAAAYIGADNAVLLIFLVHPDRGHCPQRRALSTEWENRHDMCRV